jgi:hypothetical protein
MADDPRSSNARGGGDGVRITRGPGARKEVWLLAAVSALACASILAASWLRGRTPDARAGVAQTKSGEVHRPAAPAGAALRPRARAQARVAARAAAPATRRSAPDEAPGRRSAPSAADASSVVGVEAEVEPERDPPPFTIGAPGTGIALFPPPGTDPPKIGIVVPEDFALPEGYLRHHQTTDDGKDLAPILLFHPDYEWVDERGRVIPLPADFVVPPEMAPPGLPIRMLELPEPEGASP